MRRTQFIIALVSMVVTLAASAQTYPAPTRPVRIINPFAPGGSGDAVIRVVAQKISANTGVPFVIEVKSGAGGRIGYEAGVKAAPDGYSLVITDTTFTMLPLLGSKLPWHSTDALAPVAVLAHSPFVIVTRTDLRQLTLHDFIAHAKTNAGRLNYGSAGNGTINHITTEMFKRQAGIDLLHVPFRGMTDAVTALLGGQIELILIGPLPISTHLDSGRATALAIAGPQRLPKLANVPTVDESGLPGYRAGNWFGLTAPKGTPPEALEWLHRESMKALAAAEVRDRFLDQGLVPGDSSREQFADLIEDDSRRWATVIREAGIRTD